MVVSRVQQCLLLLCLLPAAVAGNLLRGNQVNSMVQKQRNLEGDTLVFEFQINIQNDNLVIPPSAEDHENLTEVVLEWQQEAQMMIDAEYESFEIINQTIALIGAAYTPSATEQHMAEFSMEVLFANPPNDTAFFMSALANASDTEELLKGVESFAGDAFRGADAVTVSDFTVTVDPNPVEESIRSFNGTYVLPVVMTLKVATETKLDENGTEIFATEDDYLQFTSALKEWISAEFEENYPAAKSDFALPQVDVALAQTVYQSGENVTYDYTMTFNMDLFIDSDNITDVPTVTNFMITMQSSFRVNLLLNTYLAPNIAEDSVFTGITQAAYVVIPTYEVTSLQDIATAREEPPQTESFPATSLGGTYFQFNNNDSD